MNENNTAADWAAARGEKWRTHFAGMEAMLAPVNEPLIRALHLDAISRIADIGCGGGGTTIEILHRAPVGSVVHGFDISPALIELARAHLGPDERAAAFEIADIATAAGPGVPYDRLVSRFGVMFFDNPPAAFANLVQWLAPGGRVAFAVWDRPSENPWMTSVREAAAEIIELPPLDPEAPGPFRYGEAGKLRALLDRAGLGELDVGTWRGALPIGGGLRATEAADFALASFSSFGEMLAAAGGEALNRARQSLAERFSRNQRDGVVRMDTSVHIFTGVRLG
jgi:SAM-dependent methyltransferase